MTRNDFAYATGEAPAPSRLKLLGLHEDVAADVEETGFADYCDVFTDQLVRRSVAELAAVEPTAVDDNASLADTALRADVLEHEQRRRDHAERLRAATKTLDAARATRLCTPHAWSRLRFTGLVAMFVLLAVAVGLVGAIVLAPTVDESYVGNYLTPRLDSERVAMLAAYVVAAGSLALVCLCELASVVAVQGDLGPTRKALLLGVDLVVSLGWGIPRFAGELSPMAVAITLIELAFLLVYSVAIIGFGVALKRNAERARPDRDASDALRFAEKVFHQVAREVRTVERDRAEVLEPVAIRETATRKAPDLRTLAAETARTAAMIATSKLASAAARQDVDDARTEIPAWPRTEQRPSKRDVRRS